VSARRSSSTITPRWADWSDEKLLDLPLKSLRVKVGGKLLETCLDRLHAELATRGIRFRPHVWVSDEFFSPRGVSGLAVPFYLCHPRLARLEKKQMLEVEGGSAHWCMKILRHETGHALQHAYNLARLAAWRKTFGKAGAPYRSTYSPKPLSKKFVQHLGWWYAQSHPTEDFAETFAVWLRPSSRWRRTYAGWPALKKLEYVDELMADIGDRKPPNGKRIRVDTLAESRITLRDYYRRKRDRYAVDDPTIPDRDLLRLFSDDPAHARRQAASTFLRRHRGEIRERVSHWTSHPQYTVDQVLNGMILRCRTLKLRLRTSPAEARRDTLVLVTAQVMELIHRGPLQLSL
jgi:hypothetical protein